jgi:hypothetical protein
MYGQCHSLAFAFPPISPDGSVDEPSGLIGGKANAREWVNVLYVGDE